LGAEHPEPWSEALVRQQRAWESQLGNVGVASASGDDVALAAKTFANCTALNKVYPHGVGKWGARDHTSGTRVTTFKRSDTLYSANDHLDRDKDKIACEKL
jgi:hypothetical protein